MTLDEFVSAARSKFIYDPANGHLLRREKSGKWPAGARVGATDSKGHRQVRFLGKLYSEHRLIWLIVYGRWHYVAYITVGGKRRYIGYFPTIDEAIVARVRAEKEAFGMFAPTFQEEVAA